MPEPLQTASQKLYGREEQTAVQQRAEEAEDFSERRRAEEQLQRRADEFAALLEETRTRAEQLAISEERTRLIVDSAHDAFIAMDASGLILDWNQRAEIIFGWSRAEAMGQSFAQTIIPAQHREAHKRRLECFLATGAGSLLNQRIEITALHRDGHEFPVGLTITPIRWRDRFIFSAFVHDITEQKQAEEATKESEERLKLVFEAAKIGTGELDLQTSQITFSNALQRVIGLPPGTLHLTFEEYIERVHPQDRARLSQVVENAIAGQPAKAGQPDIAIDYRIVWPDGSVHWTTSRAKIFYDEAGQAIRIVAALIDITEQKRAEEELQKHREHLEDLVAERTAELAVAKNQAEEAARLKSAFLATMSHELRTPLNSIIGFTGIMLQGLAGPLNKEQQKQLTMVKNSARHLLNLINEVLDLSKIESGQVELRLESFDVGALIDKIVQTLTPLAAKKQLQLIADVTPQVDQVISDRRRVEQILINLVNNAIKFTEQGHVRIECRAGDGRLLISVVDTGIGIRPEDIPKLFISFQQLDSTLARKHEGTGLGLAICKKLIGLLGGEIWAESAWGGGSKFTFVLPFTSKEEDNEAADSDHRR